MTQDCKQSQQHLDICVSSQLASSRSNDLPRESETGHRIRDCVVNLTEVFLTSLFEVFHECNSTSLALENFKAKIKGCPEQEEEFLEECRRAFQKSPLLLSDLSSSTLTTWSSEIDIFKTLNLGLKWGDPDFTEVSKNNFRQHLIALKTCAELHGAVPTSVMTKIEHIAKNLGTKLQSGTLNFNEIKVEDLGRLLTTCMSPEEMQDLENGLPSIFQSLSQVATAVASQNGGGPNGGQNIGNFDTNAFMNLMASLPITGHETGTSASPGEGRGRGGSVSLQNMMSGLSSVLDSSQTPLWNGLRVGQGLPHLGGCFDADQLQTLVSKIQTQLGTTISNTNAPTDVGDATRAKKRRVTKTK